MTATQIAVLVVAVCTLNLGTLALAAVVARRKWRSLFGFLSTNHRAMEKRLFWFECGLRKTARKVEFRLDHPKVVTPVPLDFRAQYGEDTYLYDFFGRRTEGFFVEAGAYDGRGMSVSYVFESIGWTGLLVEAHPLLYEKCVVNRPNSTVIHAALGDDRARGQVAFTCVDLPNGPSAESFLAETASAGLHEPPHGTESRDVLVPYRSLDALLDGITDRVDFVALDVEGTEEDVLRGLDIDKYRPEALLIEALTAEAAGSVASYLAQFGFHPAMTKGTNHFYVREPDVYRFVP